MSEEIGFRVGGGVSSGMVGLMVVMRVEQW